LIENWWKILPILTQKTCPRVLEPIPITRSIAPDKQASELTSGVNSGTATKPDACVVGENVLNV